jgi:hypothetical protein
VVNSSLADWWLIIGELLEFDGFFLLTGFVEAEELAICC